MVRQCVYTVLTGGYEALNEQPAARESALPFICLTDDPDLRSDTWVLRGFSPIFAGDLLRSQRAVKLLPHRILADFDASIYIDNSVILQAAPERIFESVDSQAGLSLPAHSFRATLLDEFMAVADEKLDDPSRIAEQLAHYRAAYPELLQAPPSWNGILIRDHHDARVADAMEIWLAHICRYSRRDQLSAQAAFHLAGLRPEILAINNYKSWFHTWPHMPARKVAQRLWPDDAAAKTLALELALAARDAAFAKLRYEHDVVLKSTSWRLLESLRAIGRTIRRQ